MATSLVIEVKLDESGVVQGSQKIGAALGATGQRGSAVFARMTRDTEKAHDATLLLAQTLGIQVPRSLEKLLSRLPVVSTALSAAFKVGAFVAIGAAVVEAVNHLNDLRTTAVHALEAVYEFEQNVVSAVTGGKVDFSEARKIAEEQSFLKPLEDQLHQFQKTAATAGKEGYGALKAQAQIQLQDLTRLQAQQLDAARVKFDEGTQEYADAERLIVGQAGKVRVAIEQATNAQILELRKKQQEELEKKDYEIAQMQLTGMNLMIAQEKEALDQIALHPSQSLAPEYAAGQVTAKTTAEIEKLKDSFKVEVDKLVEETSSRALSGAAAIDANALHQANEIRGKFNTDLGAQFIDDPNSPDNVKRWNLWFNAYLNLQRGFTAIATAGSRERSKIDEQATNETISLEEHAAAEAAPPWLRSNAEIVADTNDRIRQVDEAFKASGADQQLAARQRTAIWSEENTKILEANRQLRDELAGELESVFDDITSGNIGQRILSEIKKFFFQIVAQWILSMNSIRGATAGVGGGGLLGSLLGGLFGLGGSSGGGGIISTPPFFGGSTPPGGGAPNAFPTGIFAGIGGSSVSGPLGQVLTPVGATLSAGAGTAGLAAQQKAQGIAAQTLLGSLVQKGLAKIFSHGITIGGKFISGSALGLAGLELGFLGISEAYKLASPVLGGISGAAGGALTGFAIGGPVGAVIGGIIGAISGIFGGILGRRAREKQAWDLVLQKYYPAIHQTLDAYLNYQEDAQSAYKQLSDLEKAAQAELGQLGHSGNAIFAKTIPARVLQAHQQIEKIDKDRTNRGAQIFGAPEFHTGGLFTLGGSGRAGIAVLRDGEYVVNPRATRQNRAQLEAINRGAPAAAAGEFHIHINAIDVGSFRDWLRKGGAREIRAGLRIDALEYTGSGVV